MNFEQVEKIANVVLYEGYMLYPYRPSAIKNQQRWNFGAIYPQKFSEAQNGTDTCLMQTQCLVSGDENTTLDVKVRFLQYMKRQVGKLNSDFSDKTDKNSIADSDFQAVQFLEVGDKVFQTWQEAVEREIDLPKLKLNKLIGQVQKQKFTFLVNQEPEFLHDEGNKIAGVIVRKQQTVEGEVETRIEEIKSLNGKQLFKITIRILNQTPFENGDDRDEALMRAFVSTHKILGISDGEFVSLLEPPEELSKIAAECQNIGTFPVLVGEDGTRNRMLSSPIILYDYPEIAPESMGDFFDGTEIDEMLTLRIMTLTDVEKAEMRGADEHTRKMLERTETMPVEQMMKMHGVVRATRPNKENE